MLTLNIDFLSRSLNFPLVFIQLLIQMAFFSPLLFSLKFNFLDYLFIFSIGQIGITGDTSYPQAKTDSNDDKVASELALQFYVSVYRIYWAKSPVLCWLYIESFSFIITVWCA